MYDLSVGGYLIIIYGTRVSLYHCVLYLAFLLFFFCFPFFVFVVFSACPANITLLRVRCSHRVSRRRF